MRRTNNPQWLIKDGKFIGVGLGADFTAEHEWGIKDLKNHFGVIIGVESLAQPILRDDKTLGIKRRIINEIPENLCFKEKDGLLAIFCDWWYSKEDKDIFDHSELRMHKDQKLCAAWDEKSFALVARKSEEQYMKTLWDAFQCKDILLFLGGPRGIIENAGLCFTVASSLPDQYGAELAEEDQKYIDLIKKAEATGIYELLKNAGKKWFWLGPEWDHRRPGEIMFWLNPYYQDKYNAGWYTLESLKLWAEEKGPIIKKKEVSSVYPPVN